MSPYQILEAFCQRFPDTTEAHIREFGEVVKISYKVVDEFLGCKETHTEARISQNGLPKMPC